MIRSHEVRAPTTASKTNAARCLDALNIPYELCGYEVDDSDLSAISVARKIGLPAERVFKTLLIRAASGNHVFAVIPGDAELDLKKLAKAAGEKRCEMAPLREVEPLTGYVRGGVTTLAARKPFPIFVDETVEIHESISISAGQRGLQLVLTVESYLRATVCTLSDLTKAPGFAAQTAP